MLQLSQEFVITLTNDYLQKRPAGLEDVARWARIFDVHHSHEGQKWSAIIGPLTEERFVLSTAHRNIHFAAQVARMENWPLALPSDYQDKNAKKYLAYTLTALASLGDAVRETADIAASYLISAPREGEKAEPVPTLSDREFLAAIRSPQPPDKNTDRALYQLCYNEFLAEMSADLATTWGEFQKIRPPENFPLASTTVCQVLETYLGVALPKEFKACLAPLCDPESAPPPKPPSPRPKAPGARNSGPAGAGG